ncbi:MAG: transposase [Clostridiaceae bacterium]|nr:transposase [Clostridiaceae bacterium]
MLQVIKEYNIHVNKYCSAENTKALKNNSGSTGTKFDYITRKGLFQHLWMNAELTEYHRKYIFDKYPILYSIDKCIREFRDCLSKKSLPRLYLFIDEYKNSGIKELSTFASGLEKDIDAVENAVASDLSNGFVEGTNSKVKMIKHTMYGRCGLKLLSAKLMYKADG